MKLGFFLLQEGGNSNMIIRKIEACGGDDVGILSLGKKSYYSSQIIIKGGSEEPPKKDLNVYLYEREIMKGCHCQYGR